MTKKDIAIIGGTFDPVHNGHIDMAKYLSDNYLADEIWMLPSYNSPHKNSDTKNSFIDRVNMLKIAFPDDKNIKISTFEKEYYENSGDVKTYTLDILDAISKKYLNIHIYFIVGFDSIKDISKWHNYQELLRKYFFYIFDRKDNEFTTIEQKKIYIDNLGNKFCHHRVAELLNHTVPDISSTHIRELLKDNINNKEKLLKMIPEKVYNYIVEHNLYGF